MPHQPQICLTCPKHAPDVGVSLIKAFVHNSVKEGRPMEEESLVVMAVVLLGHFLLTMTVFLPQSLVTYLLNLQHVVAVKMAPDIVLVLTDTTLHLQMVIVTSC